LKAQDQTEKKNAWFHCKS